MHDKTKQERMAEELQYLEDAIAEYIKSIKVAKRKLMEGSKTEYGYVREKVWAIEDVAKYVRLRLKEMEKSKELLYA